VIILGERECSIQRRHQKLVEEAPSVAVDTRLREELNHAAKKGLEAAGYTNAGTVEFLVESSGAFYFLEVNKRLQVEHLVTELTTRTDIVEEQMNVSENGSLGLSQNEIHVAGWAINCRINAEDPREGFIPTPGTIVHYHAPSGPGVRIDSALFSGCSVPEFYDSLVAKLATWGTTRLAAIRRMSVALEETEIVGVPTTVPLHRELMRDERFLNGRFDTTFLNDFLPRLDAKITEHAKYAAVVAAVEKAKNPRPWSAGRSLRRSGWRTVSGAH
jgi:acetyl-CoA carboxylase biotin carboxylase subunit